MPPKRKRRASLTSRGLAPGEPFKRSALPGNNSSPWGWVGTEVNSHSDITSEHLLVTCGLSQRNKYCFCPNKYHPKTNAPEQLRQVMPADEDFEDEIIIISDNEQRECSHKICRTNPNCLNYLGQEEWEEDEVVEAFMNALKLRENPILDEREPDFPVGLKNLGATCYANASLQVWFRDLKFRSGVYICQASEDAEDKFKDSPIFQLQVTFAALQESTQSVYNPTKLVESLQLRTTEQQDAQEFSKLFMSHLDAEFKKQEVPAVKNLITDQFQGKQIYGTICNLCQYRSERSSDFLEIEINFGNNAKLEDRISALLQPETLSGDNKYLCSQCDSLQDATRYTEIRELPPVLHFSLLRFVYDTSTMERKKLKHSVSFPPTLDMSQFLNCRGTSPPTPYGDHIYELRGVLLHKGPSAYHGHYEAQVYDSLNASWFQFNDETVTKIKSPGANLKPSSPIIEIDDNGDSQPSSSQSPGYRDNSKQHRVDDSDDESVRVIAENLAASPTNITSKDAYMLIYARKESLHPSESMASLSSLTTLNTDIPLPPSRALEIVQSLNAAHDNACDTFNEREALAKARFQRRRQTVMDIYRGWNVQSTTESSVIVSQQSLRMWLSQYNGDSAALVASHDVSDVQFSQMQVQLSDILCVHQRIDPGKAAHIKRISKKAHERICNETGYVFQPFLTADDVCAICVEASFKEKLYQIEHPRLVNQFDRIAEVAKDCKGYWISKPWLKDWRLMRPKMHVASKDDPAPDSHTYNDDVLCGHQLLSINTTSRRRISAEAVDLLRTLFPKWRPLQTDAESCPVCDALVHISKEDKRETRKKAEHEKAKLKYMYDHVQIGDMALPESKIYTLIPSSFLKNWKKWLNQPTETSRPETVDNTPFICEHDLLNLDLNHPTDFDSSFALIRRADWNVLETFYPGGPLIAVEKHLQENTNQWRILHDIPVCVGCRLKRKLNWASTEIIVSLHGSKGPGKHIPKDNLTNYLSKSGARQSKRIRKMREFGQRRKLTILKSTTVKEIKVMLQNELNISTICQRLFHQGNELQDNLATVASLQIHANDELELKEENEVIEITSDSEGTRPREEGRGFGGTLLGSSIELRQEPATLEVFCPACTFRNEPGVLTCGVCDTSLDPT